MEARLDYGKLAPDAMRALYSLGAYLAKCGLEHPLLELVKIRASQINGCAYGLPDTHHLGLPGVARHPPFPTLWRRVF
jgi:alkylhydroperoxidase family enzyme